MFLKWAFNRTNDVKLLIKDAASRLKREHADITLP